MTEDEKYIQRTFALAEKARGRTSPNPLVGCVIVKDGKIVGEGFHTAAGKPHAEIVALQNAGQNARQATVYVNLEPCCHYGRTPPCTKALIAAGVKRVVAAMKDPDPRVAGNGFAELEKNGIIVDYGFLIENAHRLNEVFLKCKQTHLPFITLKWAISVDGRIATSTGHSRWITSPEARQRGHQLRNEVDAILVGIGTVLADDPLLNVRLEHVDDIRHPVRIILDRQARLPLDSQLVKTASQIRTIVVANKANSAKIEQLQANHVDVWQFSTNGGELLPLLEKLVAENLCSVLIEGGATISTTFLRERLVDKMMIFIAPKLIGGDGISVVDGLGVLDMEQALQLRNRQVELVGPDILMTGYFMGFKKLTVS